MSLAITDDLHAYLALMLERGDINVVETEVDPLFELAAVVSQSQKESGRAVLFKKVRGSNFPVVANIYGSFTRMSEMVATGEMSLQKRWKQIFETRTEDNDYIDIVGAPENTVTGKINDLPHITWHEKDAAPYINAGVILRYVNHNRS